MILGFSTINKRTKEPTCFVAKIQLGIKRHTLRRGNRWRQGMSIHMATGVRTKNYDQFNSNMPELQTCKSVQSIKLIRVDDMSKCRIIIDGRELTLEESQELAWNDGFSCLADFWIWFDNPDEFPNQIIHWTDLKY
jgi:hypothetical protein